jgi:ribosomal protein S12 methylthiotransferase
VPSEEIAERLRYLHALQDDITAQRNAAAVGRRLSVLVDQVEDGLPVGRSYREAPEIDGMIVLDRGEAGEWVEAEIDGGYGNDLSATVVTA